MPFYIKASDLSYSFGNGNCLFKNINFTLSAEKAGLVGPNGCGKSTLLKLITGELMPVSGSIEVSGSVTRFLQDQTHLADYSVAEALGVYERLTALRSILAGTGTENDYLIIDNHWDIEDRIEEALALFGLKELDAERKFATLSGGEAGRLLLAACMLKQTDFILFDEPTNHLDLYARESFYKMIETYNKGMLIVSHDRQLLKRVDKIIELTDKGLKTYGGNYDFYIEQKQIEQNAIEQKITEAESSLKKQIKLSAAVISSKEKKNVFAKQNRENGGILKAVLNKRRGNAERTTAKLIDIHEKKINKINDNLNSYKNLADKDYSIKIDIDDAKLKNKLLATAYEINYIYTGHYLWKQNLSFEIRTGERVLIMGRNGSGKTTLINIITQKLPPSGGVIKTNCGHIGIIDQRYEMLDSKLSLLDNMRMFAPSAMPEHELRIRLARFLFFGDDAHKTAGVLSGGEKSRLAMACLLASANLPDMIILDEPTNNLDLQSIMQMQEALNAYKGALIVISHDIDFIESVGITKTINLDDFV